MPVRAFVVSDSQNKSTEKPKPYLIVRSYRGHYGFPKNISQRRNCLRLMFFGNSPIKLRRLIMFISIIKRIPIREKSAGGEVTPTSESQGLIAYGSFSVTLRRLPDHEQNHRRQHPRH